MPLDPTGVTGPTRGEARSRKWRRTTRGFYVPAHVDSTVVEQRILEQSMLLPEFGAVTGWAACRLRRAAFFDGLLPDGFTQIPVLLLIGPLGQLRPHEGVSLSRERVLHSEIVVVHGIRCARLDRALFDEMRRVGDLREAVVAMDMMAAAELLSVGQMRGYVLEHPGWTGVPRVREALDLASEASRSPNETRLRLIWQLDAGLPRPLVNQPVFTRGGRLIGYPDLLDPIAGVVGEYDGADHRGARRHSKDVAREEDLRRAGLEYFKVTGPDMGHVSRIVSRMHSTRSRALWLPPERRAWTLDLPAGWEKPLTLDQKLEHGAVMAAIYEQQEQEGDPDIAELMALPGRPRQP